MTEKMHIIVRADGRYERMCEHGVGHCIGHHVAWQDWMAVHGCDGCCSKWHAGLQGSMPHPPLPIIGQAALEAYVGPADETISEIDS